MATSAGLNITKYVVDQKNPDITINKILDILDALARTLTHNMASDADYTLATTGTEPFEWQFGTINITDTDSPVWLSTGRNIIVPVFLRSYRFVNNTAQALTLKTPSGSGIAVAAGNYAILDCNGTNIVRVTPDQP